MKRILPFVMVLFLCNCKEDTKTISSKTILQIDSIKIPEYTFYREYDRFKNGVSQQTGKQKLTDTLNSFVKTYINDRYLLAAAYEKRYDTINSLKESVNVMAEYMLSRYKGYLWNAVEEPKLKISDEEIEKAYEKSKKIFYVKLLIFHNPQKTDLEKTSSRLNKAGFERLVSENKERQDVQFINVPITYPVSDLFDIQDQIYEMKSGDIQAIKSQFGYLCLIYVTNIEDIRVKSLEQEKERLRQALTQGKEKMLITAKQYEIKQKAKVHIDELVGNNLVEKFVKNEEKSLSPDFLKRRLYSYTFNDKIIDRTVQDFIKSYNKQMLRSSIGSVQQLVELIDENIRTVYLVDESNRLGITKQADFLFDKENFMHGCMIAEYRSRIILPTVAISDADIESFYKENKHLYTMPESVSCKIYTFNSATNAYNAFNMLTKADQTGVMSNKMTGLTDFFEGSLKCNGANKYPSSVKDALIELPLNKPCEPISNDGLYYVLVKVSEQGNCYKDFHLVKTDISKVLREKKFNEALNAEIEILKEKHKLVINNIKI